MKKSLGYYTVYYAIYSKYWLLTWIKIIPFVLKHGIFNTLRDLRRYPWLVIMLKVNRLLWTLGKGRSKRYQLATSLIISGVVTGVTEMLGRIFFKPDRLIIHEDMVPPEIFRAMGLSTFVAERKSFRPEACTASKSIRSSTSRRRGL